MKEKYPIGVETFSEIVEGGYVYVDKTEAIHRLVTEGKYYFLSRPRRFGKSLLLSTIEAYFEGRRELFRGLYLDRDDLDWKPRPVFRLNFVTTDASNIKGLTDVIESHLSEWEQTYGVAPGGYHYSQRFSNVIKAAYECTGQKVAVLIDEYDKALVNSLHDEALHEDMRKVLRPIFSVLKGSDRYIEFAMLTGVSRFSRLSIFSDLNNLNDISLTDSYGAVCGFTDVEIRRSFPQGIKALTQRLGVTEEEVLEKLKENFDGYHFSADCPDIYNPFSLLNTFYKLSIEHSWFASGTPEFLTRQMQASHEDVAAILSPEADGASLSSSDTMHADLTALLFQTGYLTIKSYDRELEEYRLGIPNREVERGLFKCLLPQYSGKSTHTGSNLLRAIRGAVNGGHPNIMMEHLESFLADIPYHLSGNKPEAYFQNNLYIIFKLLGLSVTTEYSTSRGRIDIFMQTPDYLYVMELKLDGTVEEALAQISATDYTLPFKTDGRTLYRIGVNFSKSKRNIDNWAIQDAFGITLWSRQ